MSTSFGQWYDEQKAGESGESGSSWFGAEQMLPLFDTESMQNFSFANMKSAMEAQMPKKIMGMGYQQRFQVRYECHSFELLSAKTNALSMAAFLRRFSVVCSFYQVSFSLWHSLSGFRQWRCIHTNFP